MKGFFASIRPLYRETSKVRGFEGKVIIETPPMFSTYRDHMQCLKFEKFNARMRNLALSLPDSDFYCIKSL